MKINDIEMQFDGCVALIDFEAEYRKCVYEDFNEVIPIPFAGSGHKIERRYAYPGGVYVLVGVDTGTIYYVGKAVDLKVRLSQHSKLHEGAFSKLLEWNEIQLEMCKGSINEKNEEEKMKILSDYFSKEDGALDAYYIIEADEHERILQEHQLISICEPILNKA